MIVVAMLMFMLFGVSCVALVFMGLAVVLALFSSFENWVADRELERSRLRMVKESEERR